MVIINGINEVANPLLIFAPLVLMILSGYTIGRVIFTISKIKSSFFKELLYGNITLTFIFISGFIVFGFLISSANLYFTIFTYVLIAFTLVGTYLIVKLQVATRPRKRVLMWLFENKHVTFGVGLFLSVIVYQAFVTFYHPIFLEYDAIYVFLLISKSILLGDGLNHDFYIGSDIALRLPPLSQAFNAWLIHSFGYSAMRLFPIYFILLGSLFVYRFARNVTKDSFLGIIASCAFLITPALLIISSHFSLQQDIAFIFLLSTTFYFVSEIIRHEKPASIHILMLVLSLSLLSLTREIGVVVSVAIFFLIPAMKFTQSNIKIRAIFTVLSLLPLYVLTLYDIVNNGLTNSMGIRLVSLILANITIFYISYHMKNQSQLKELFQPTYKYLIFLVIPLIFFASNIITIGGPFATIIFSSQFGESAILHRQVFDITKNLELYEALRQNLPRADIFLVAIAMGSTFVFLRLRGFIRLVVEFRSNIHYPLILILSIALLLVWSYLLESGFESSRIRHIAYFLPITSTLIVIAMNRKGTVDRLFYYGIIVFSTYYFLNQDLEIWNYRGQFGGFYIEPYRSAIMNLIDFIPASIIILLLLLYESREGRIANWFRTRLHFARYSHFVFIGLLSVQIYTLSSSGLSLSALSTLDQVPPPEWEENVFEVVNYLKSQDKGNVLSLRAPAISFFTNRTNFDIYNPHTFSYIYPLLLADKNATEFKEKISDMGINYIVIPNERSSLYTLTQNLKRSSALPQIIENDEAFERIDFSDFSVYEFNPRVSSSINLLDDKNKWEEFGPLTRVLHVNGSVQIEVFSTIPDKVYNRAFMKTQLNSTMTESPLLLFLEYASESDSRKSTTYSIEIRDKNQNPLWGQTLRNTNGTSTGQNFVIPEDLPGGPLEFRLYVITESIGVHTLNVSNARIVSR